MIRVRTDQVDGHLIPAVGNRIAVAIYLNGLGCRQTAKAEFLKQREQPAFARIGGGGIAGWFCGDGFFEILPAAFEPVPTAIDLLIEPLALGQMIGYGRDAIDGGFGIGQLMQKIRRQQSAFGRDGDEG